MAITEFTEEQKITLTRVLIKLEAAEYQLNKINDELYALGSFPESPVGHASSELKLTQDYIKSWLNEGGVEI